MPVLTGLVNFYPVCLFVSLFLCFSVNQYPNIFTCVCAQDALDTIIICMHMFSYIHASHILLLVSWLPAIDCKQPYYAFGLFYLVKNYGRPTWHCIIYSYLFINNSLIPYIQEEGACNISGSKMYWVWLSNRPALDPAETSIQKTFHRNRWVWNLNSSVSCEKVNKSWVVVPKGG